METKKLKVFWSYGICFDASILETWLKIATFIRGKIGKGVQICF